MLDLDYFEEEFNIFTGHSTFFFLRGGGNNKMFSSFLCFELCVKFINKSGNMVSGGSLSKSHID